MADVIWLTYRLASFSLNLFLKKGIHFYDSSEISCVIQSIQSPFWDFLNPWLHVHLTMVQSPSRLQKRSLHHILLTTIIYNTPFQNCLQNHPMTLFYREVKKGGKSCQNLICVWTITVQYTCISHVLSLSPPLLRQEWGEGLYGFDV